MFNLTSSIVDLLTTKLGSSFMCLGLTFKYLWSLLGNLITKLFNFIVSIFWVVVRFVLGVLEALEFIINQFLGIDTTIGDYYAFAKNTEMYSSLVKTFRAVCGVAIVLLIIFTIFAIIMQEWRNATGKSGMSPEGNNVKPIIINAFKKILTLVAFPIIMVFVITGVNSILTAFSRAIKGDNNSTVASQVLYASCFDANKYRKYATEGKRIPIIIEAYDASSYGSDQNEQLTYKIKSAEVQSKLLSTATMMSNSSYLSFNDSLIYKNNQLANSANFGDYYETFVCTAEQYQVMADFIDYAQKTALTYYIKAMDDEDIEWKYVDSSVYDQNSQTLTINYRDANDLNNNNKKNDSYSITYAMSYSISSPISDALDSILAMLGIGDYSDNLYKTMERDEDSINIVQWANDKALIKLSNGFVLSDVNTWNEADQIIMYEYYRYASNNTFGGVSVDTLKSEGIELDAKQIVYRDYYAEADAYSPEKYKYVVDINNNYYQIEQSDDLRDSYGNKYYVLKTIVGDTGENVFLERNYTTIERMIDRVSGSTNIYKTATLKLSECFNLNDTSTWKYSDQIIVYEYYKDLTPNNIFYSNSFEDFKTAGVSVPVYTITNYTYSGVNYSNNSTNYALINGVYYQIDDTYTLKTPTSGETNFLVETSKEEQFYYTFEVKINDTDGRFGVTTESELTADSLIYQSSDIKSDVYADESGAYNQNFELLNIDTTMSETLIEKLKTYEAFTLKLSSNFDYRNTSTWTYRDYFIFYMYAMHPEIAGSGGLSTLKFTGVSGEIGKVQLTDETADTYVIKVAVSGDRSIYIDIEKAMKLSGLNMLQTLDVEKTIFNNYVDTLTDNLFYTITSLGASELLNEQVSCRTFAFSEKFSRYDVSTWTVQDLILMIMSESEVIGDVQSILASDYNAQIYNITIGTGEDAETDTLYRFGQVWNASTSSKTIFLSERSILNMKSNTVSLITTNVDAWLAGSAIEFIAKKLGLSLNEIISDNSSLLESVYKSTNEYMYSQNAFISLLAEKYVLNSVTKTDSIEIVENIASVTYENSAFDADNLSTWTRYDLLVYAITGSAYGSYTSNVIYDDAGESYFVIGDKAVKLTGNYDATITNNNKISSIAFGFTGTTLNDLKSNPTYDGLVVTGNQIATKNLIKKSNFKFNYYYDVSLENLKNATVLDVLLAKNNIITSSSLSVENKEFEIWTDGSLDYLMLKSKTEAPTEKGIYAVISQSAFDNVSYSSKVTLTPSSSSLVATEFLSKNLFEKYNEFVSGTDSLENAQLSQLESVVFDLTGSTEKKEYKIYKILGDDNCQFIKVDNYYIEVSSLSIEPEGISNSTKNTWKTNGGILQDYLYDNYYSEYVDNNVSGFMVGGEFNYEVKFNLNYDDNNPLSWSPLSIILKKIGYSVGSDQIVGKIQVTENNKNYLYISWYNAEKAGVLEEYYIYIDELATISRPGDTGYTSDYSTINLLRNTLYENILRMKAVTISSGSVVNNNSNLLSFTSTLNSKLSIGDLSTTADSQFYTTWNGLSDVTDNWNWSGILTNYYFGGFKSSVALGHYRTLTGEKYLRLDFNGGYVYIKNDSNLTTNFSTEDVSIFLFDPNNPTGNISVLSIVNYQLTNNASSETLNKYTISSSSDYFYYIENRYTGIYQAVYNLNPLEETVNFGTESTTTYSYRTKDISELKDWSILDYIISYVGYSTDETTIKAQKTTFKGNEYLNYNNKLIKTNGYSVITKIADFNDSTNLITPSGNLSSLIQMGRVTSETYLKDYVLQEFDSTYYPVVSTGTAGTAGTVEKVYFSKNFDPSDYSTWKLSDFIIYYLFENGYFDNATDSSKSITNFETLVRQGYAPAYVWYLISTDSNGSVQTKKVYSFTTNVDGRPNGNYVNFDLFKLYYSRNLIGKEFVSTENELNFAIESSNSGLSNTYRNFYVEVKNDINAKDFVYNNYYYYKVKFQTVETNFGFTDTGIYNIDSELIGQIEQGSANYKYNINLKLSEVFVDDSGKFQMADIKNWTVLDFIILYEYSKNVKSNIFYGIALEELINLDNYFLLFTDEEEETQILSINGSYYNLKNFISNTDANGSAAISPNEKFVNAKINNFTIETNSFYDIISLGKTNDYSFKVLKNSIDYKILKNSGLTYEIPTNKTFKFSVEMARTIGGASTTNSVTFVREINSNISSAFTVNTKELHNCTVSSIVREVNWPQKLMNDMKVLYPDLNWNTLIATDGWLDTLGDFSSAYTSGEFITSGNSSNTTAAGLVLSEFFLSVAKESEQGYSAYEYESVFDENTIKALMLAMLGESEYKQLSMQAEIFMEMFNIAFAPVLEDIANARGINIVDGKVDNFTMSVYKSYLATALLSSDMGEYLYKVANRVYAQYTIYESLASASGDYAKYLAFMEGKEDENGETINSFMYSSFYELLKYENIELGSVAPTYTFNVARVYKFLNPDTTLTDSDIRNNIFSSESEYQSLFNDYYSYYQNVYSKGSKIKDNEEIYCFMFDCYFSIKKELNDRGTKDTFLPTYLKLYNKYLKGEIKRWGTVQGVSIEGGSSKIQKYELLEVALQLSKITTFAAIAPLLTVDNITYDTSNNEEASNYFEMIKLLLQNTDINCPLKLFNDTFSTSITYSENLNYIKTNVINLLAWTTNSEDGDTDAWNNLITYNNKLSGLLSELSLVCSLSVGNMTDSGSIKLNDYSDDYYDSCYNKLANFQQGLNNYITAQQQLDVITKTSITYTLAQFGQNYIADGYVFNVGNRAYTVGVSFSASRLAEYVFGGSYLASFGLPAEFTDEEFEGFITTSKVFDSSTGIIKTNLGMWTLLRKFVSEIANYTGKLYYLTNLNDLSDNVGDDILLTDNLRDSAEKLTTPELLILKYLINTDISADTLIRLMFGDTTNSLNALYVTNTNIKSIANWLEGNSVSLSDENKRQGLSEYLDLVYSSSYNSNGYYNNRTNANERIHLIFKKVISYLLVSEESEESYSEKAVNLENLTFKDLKVLLMNGLVNYEKNPSETDSENSGRYLALFNLVCTQFNYTVSRTGESDINARTIDANHLTNDTSSSSYIETKYKNSSTEYLPITVSFAEDKTTQDMIIKLAGAENQPIENLVNLEYKDLYNMEGNYDEANGDTFIVCTYDEILGKYIPVLMSNIDVNTSAESEETNYQNYYNKYYYKIRSSYLDTTHYYPLVAKGIIDEAGRPTAIRMVDYEIQYYRNNISASSTVDDNAITRTKITAETNTVGYTNYTSTTMQDEQGNKVSKDRTMFLAESSLGTVVKSDFSVYYLQTTDAYNLETSDELGGINVLDSFSAFYKLDYIAFFMLYIALATMLPLMFKSTMSVFRRILDIGALIFLGPWAIAVSAMETPNSKSSIFQKWVGNMTKSLLSAFGFVIGFNVYYILVSTITNMTFISEITVAKIHNIGGFSFLTQSMLNMVIMLAFVLTATGSIESSANILVGIVSCKRVSNAFESGTGDAFKDVKKVVHDIIENKNKIKGVVNGEILINAKAAAVEMAKKAVPGSAIIAQGVDVAQKLNDKRRAKKLQKLAEDNGVPPALAKQAAENFKRNVQQQREIKRKQQLDRANKFMGQVGISDGKTNFFEKAPPLIPPKKEDDKDKKSKKKKPKKKKDKKKDKKKK